MTQEKGIDKVLTALVTEEVSDIHFKVGSAPIIREGGRIIHAPGYTAFEPQHIDQIISEMLTEFQEERFRKGKEAFKRESYENALRCFERARKLKYEDEELERLEHKSKLLGNLDRR